MVCLPADVDHFKPVADKAQSTPHYLISHGYRGAVTSIAELQAGLAIHIVLVGVVGDAGTAQ